MASTSSAASSPSSASAEPFEGAKANLLDRALAWVSPEAAVRRLVARQTLRQFGWDGAKRTHERGRARAHDNQNPETPQMQRSRVELMWEARELYRNLPVIRGTVDRLCMYVVGRLAYKARTGDAEVDKKIESYLHGWARRADWTERFTFRKLVEMALKGMILDGDAALLPLSDYDETTGEGSGELRLQGVDSDRIGDPTKVGVDHHRPHGMWLNARGGIAEFEIYKCDANNRYTLDKKVGADKVIYLVDPFRVTMYRGVSALATAIPRARDLYEAIRLEMAAAKMASAYAGFFTEQAEGEAPEWDEPAAANGETQLASMQVVPGRIQKVRGRGEIKFAPPTARPSGAFLALMEVLAREVSNALNVPYGFAYKLGDLGGVTQRVEVMQLQRLFEYYRHLLEDRVLNRVRDLVLAYGLAYGKIPYHERYKEGVWLWGAHLTADVGHDTNARLAMLQAGLTTRTREVGYLHGDDYSALLEEGAAEVTMQREVAERVNAPIEMLPGGHPEATMLLAGKAEGEAMETGGEGAPAESPPPPPETEPEPPPGLVGKLGAKEMKAMLDVIKSYNRQEVTREQAVTLLVSQYGVDLAEAEELVGP